MNVVAHGRGERIGVQSVVRIHRWELRRRHIDKWFRNAHLPCGTALWLTVRVIRMMELSQMVGVAHANKRCHAFTELYIRSFSHPTKDRPQWKPAQLNFFYPTPLSSVGSTLTAFHRIKYLTSIHPHSPQNRSESLKSKARTSAHFHVAHTPRQTAYDVRAYDRKAMGVCKH